MGVIGYKYLKLWHLKPGRKDMTSIMRDDVSPIPIFKNGIVKNPFKSTGRVFCQWRHFSSL